LIETMNTSREARACAQAARAAGLVAIVSFACGDDARLLSGEPLADALAELRDAEPAGIGVNCLPPSRVVDCLDVLRRCGAPFAVYPNLGAPIDAKGTQRSEEHDPDALAALAGEWLDAGARVVGGCCGTTPAHLRALATRLRR
jgi:S-methylmethionine-dependent homocysteine/selenocysteine methylase